MKILLTILIVIIAIIIITLFAVFYNEIFAVTFDETFAKAAAGFWRNVYDGYDFPGGEHPLPAGGKCGL